MNDMNFTRPRGDGGWLGVITLLLVPLAIIGLPVGILCIYLAFKI